MSDPLESFSKAAQSLSRNPLGIIALFIVLVYGFAALVTAFSGSFSAGERAPLIYFMVIFPILVLGIFAWLVSRHSAKLFAPGDFRSEDNYVKLMSASAASIALASSVKAEADASPPDIESIVSSVRDSIPRDGVVPRNRVLWVDDRPENNINERQAFRQVGLDISLALSTDEALARVASEDFALVISDMTREEGPREGFVLLEKLRERDTTTPYLIYAGRATGGLKAEARALGAQGATNSPQELFRTSMSLLISQPRSAAISHAAVNGRLPRGAGGRRGPE